MKFCVIEDAGNYIICHGSWLSWAEAHLLALSEMYNDSQTVENGTLQNVKMYELEANNPGFGINYDCDGRTIQIYILEDPGRPDDVGKK